MADQRIQDLEALRLARREIFEIESLKAKNAANTTAIKKQKESDDKTVLDLPFTPSEKRKRLDAEYRYYHRKHAMQFWKVLATIFAVLGAVFALASCVYLFPLAAQKITDEPAMLWIFYIVHAILCLILVILPFIAIPSPGFIGSDEQKEAAK